MFIGVIMGKNWSLLILFAFLSLASLIVAQEKENHTTIWPQTQQDAIYPPIRYRPYQIVTINDTSTRSAGIYVRLSQKGLDYLTELAADVLPGILQRMVLPTVEESGLSVKNIVITRFDRPEIKAKYISGHGVAIEVTMPILHVNGDFQLDFFFVTGKGQMRAVVQNLTIAMKVHIHRDMITNTNNVTVYECNVTQVPIELKFFGPDTAGMEMMEETISSEIQNAISEKVCFVPSLVKDFLEAERQEILSPTDPTFTTTAGPLFENYLCGFDPTSTPEPENPVDELEESIVNQGLWAPDLTLTYPPAFSDKDAIVGIDAGIVLNGETAPDSVPRPKFANVTVVRDQMLGLIVSEYVPNSFLHHLYTNDLGTIHASFNLKENVPKGLRTLTKLACSDCKVIIDANLTSQPVLAIDYNGLAITIDGNIDLKFLRKNKTSDLIGAEGKVRILVKPHFRNSKIYSEISMTGVDFKVYKVGMRGIFASTARKFLNFIVPKAVWPKIQKRLRFLINQKGIDLPRICGMELQKLHIDYIRHAVILSSDFTVDKDHLLMAFKQFMDDDLRNTETIKELNSKVHYL